jgi:hypothetical protein
MEPNFGVIDTNISYTHNASEYTRKEVNPGENKSMKVVQSFLSPLGLEKDNTVFTICQLRTSLTGTQRKNKTNILRRPQKV